MAHVLRCHLAAQGRRKVQFVDKRVEGCLRRCAHRQAVAMEDRMSAGLNQDLNKRPIKVLQVARLDHNVTLRQDCRQLGGQFRSLCQSNGPVQPQGDSP